MSKPFVWCLVFLVSLTNAAQAQWKILDPRYYLAQQLATVSRQFYDTLTPEQKAQADRGDEVRITELTSEQRFTAFGWLVLSAKIRPLPAEVSQQIAEQKIDIIQQVRVIGKPASIRIWTVRYFFNRIGATDKTRAELEKLQAKKTELIKALLDSLTTSQKSVAQPTDSANLWSDPKGLWFEKLKPEQQKTLAVLAQVNAEISLFYFQDTRPGKAENYRVFFWADQVHFLPQAFLRLDEAGIHLTPRQIGGPAVERQIERQRFFAFSFWQALKTAQKKDLTSPATTPCDKLAEKAQQQISQILEIELRLQDLNAQSLEQAKSSCQVWLEEKSSRGLARTFLVLQTSQLKVELVVEGRPETP